jgi:hypothetical protein
MKLLSLEMEHKYATLVKAFSSEYITLLIVLHFKTLSLDDSGSFWTSGTDQGCVGSFAWCAARKILYKPKWAQGHPVNSTQAQCVAVSVDASAAQLETSDCAIANKFICEVLFAYFSFIFERSVSVFSSRTFLL